MPEARWASEVKWSNREAGVGALGKVSHNCCQRSLLSDIWAQTRETITAFEELICVVTRDLLVPFLKEHVHRGQ